MVNLSPEICKKLREARKEAGLSQSELSREIGCKQSALSMFEQGDGTKLNDEAVGKLCQKFGIKMEETVKSSTFSVSPATAAERGFCPNPFCPSHFRYSVEGKTYLRPDREKQDPVKGKYCAVCGEVLEKNCPECGASVHDGAVCSFCGKPYIPVFE